MAVTLPIIASYEDALQIVQFLKTKVTGCAIEDAKAVIDKKYLDPRKINAYIIWSLITRDGEKIKLTELGKRLSRINETDYPEVFTEVLQSIEPYHCALERLFYQKDTEQVTNVEIASYWYETKKFGMDAVNENALKDMAVCYFRICEAAGISKLFIGRRGQATRLEINRNQLGQYIGRSTLSQTETVTNDSLSEEVNYGENISSQLNIIPSYTEIQSTTNITDDAIKIFFSHGNNMGIIEQIKTLIDLANLEYEVAVETETAAIPIPDKVFGAMRRCNSAVICVSAGENDKKEDGTYGINQNVLIELVQPLFYMIKKLYLYGIKELISHLIFKGCIVVNIWGTNYLRGLVLN